MCSVEDYRDAAFEQVIKVGKAFGNVSRIKLLDNLIEGKKSVEELAKAVGLSVGTASKNLQILKKVNLVKEEKDKNFVYYELASAKVAKLITLLIDISEDAIPELKELEKHLKRENSNLLRLSIPELKEKLEKTNPYVLDLRPKSEFEEGHLPGAHNIPFNEIDLNLNKFPYDRKIVVYCRGRLCAYSDVIGNKLKLAGYDVETFNNTVWEWNNELRSN